MKNFINVRVGNTFFLKSARKTISVPTNRFLHRCRSDAMMANDLSHFVSQKRIFVVQIKKVYKSMKSKAIIFFLGGLLLSGCGYELPKTTNTAGNSTNSAALSNQNTKNQTSSAINVEQTNKNAGAANSKTGEGESGEAKLILSGSGESTTHACNGREVEVEESATAISYNLTGECKKLTVDGVSVTVNVEKVGEIVVKGVSNKVVYVEGIGGKKPKITKSGTSTSAETKAEAEKKKSETK